MEDQDDQIICEVCLNQPTYTLNVMDEVFVELDEVEPIIVRGIRSRSLHGLPRHPGGYPYVVVVRRKVGLWATIRTAFLFRENVKDHESKVRWRASILLGTEASSATSRRISIFGLCYMSDDLKLVTNLNVSQ